MSMYIIWVFCAGAGAAEGRQEAGVGGCRRVRTAVLGPARWLCSTTPSEGSGEAT